MTLERCPRQTELERTTIPFSEAGFPAWVIRRPTRFGLRRVALRRHSSPTLRNTSKCTGPDRSPGCWWSGRRSRPRHRRDRSDRNGSPSLGPGFPSGRRGVAVPCVQVQGAFVSGARHYSTPYFGPRYPVVGVAGLGPPLGQRNRNPRNALTRCSYARETRRRRWPGQGEPTRSIAIRLSPSSHPWRPEAPRDDSTTLGDRTTHQVEADREEGSNRLREGSPLKARIAPTLSSLIHRGRPDSPPLPLPMGRGIRSPLALARGRPKSSTPTGQGN